MTFLAVIVAALLQFATSAETASAQTKYSYLPSASTTDFRFLSITGAGIQTLGDQILLFKISAPANTTNFQFGVFDGETGGQWDQGTQPMEYTLFADPNNDATGTYQVAQWSGASMPDNAWYNATVTNVSQARSVSGAFFYLLRVKATDYSTMFWSNFKLRVSGSIVALRLTNIAYTAPMSNQADALAIYPNYPILTPTVYDGVWEFLIQVPAAQTSISVWDGDLDHGNADCTDNDNDDPDTPNQIPPFATGAAVVAEGTATSTLGCQDALGIPTGGTTTSNPADNSRNPVFRRDPAIRYDLIDPNGKVYANNNPSGNLEWEQFRVDVAPFNRATMDYHADSLPAGIYRIRISGVDLSNLNAIRSPFDILGVDSIGIPQEMPTPFSITGRVGNDVNRNGRIDTDEVGIPGAIVTLNNGRKDTTGDDGRYSFPTMQAGAYTVRVTLPICSNDDGDNDNNNNHHRAVSWRHRYECGGGSGSHNNDDDDDDDLGGCCNWSPTFDFDGILTTASQNLAAVVLTLQVPNPTVNFGYQCADDDDNNSCDRDNDHRDCGRGRDYDCSRSHDLSYWACHQSSWGLSKICVGDRTYSKSECVKIIQKATSSCDDKTYVMAAQQICAKLNRACGDNSTSMNNRIKDCDDWMRRNCVGSRVRDCSGSSWRSSGKRICDHLQSRNTCSDDDGIR